jgi:iron complex outermembrane recepter protein
MKIRASRACRELPPVIAGALVALAVAPVYAEDQLAEVVVTAQKRAENIQEVPIAVTAVTAAQLESKGINEVAKLGNLAPNVTLDAGTPFSGSNTVLSAYIRGIGQNDFAFNQDPGVGVYVDGVYLARSVGANTTMMDVERVEILKGPQGTLFGRNTIGGAISIVTRDPGPDFMFRGEVTTGQLNRLDTKGTADLPISDKLRTSISFSTAKRDGYQRRIQFTNLTNLPPSATNPLATIPDCLPVGSQCAFTTDPATSFPAAGYASSDREGGENQWNLRAKLVYLATDDVRFTLTGDYQNVDQSALPNTVLGINPSLGLGGVYNACLVGAPLGVLCTLPRGGLSPTPTPMQTLPPLGGVNVDGNKYNNALPYDNRFETGNIDQTYSTGNSFSKLKNWGVSTTLDWAITSSMNLKWINAYRALHWDAGMDLDGSPLPILETSFDMPQHEISEELQLNGKVINDRLNYAIGAYYFREAGHLHDFVTFPGGLLMIDGPNDLTTRAEAIYAHLNYKLTEKLSVTAGGRYTKEHKLFESHQTDDNGLTYKLSGCFPPTDPAGAHIPGLPPTLAARTCQQFLGFPSATEPYQYYPPGVQTLNFSNTSPTFGFEYRFTPDLMAYASYSKGYKTGSWTTRLSAPHSTYDTSLHFDPEFAKAEEIGLKSEWFERRLRVNLAAFHTKYDGIQLNSQQGISPTLVNAGDARIYGFELEAEGLIKGGLSFNAALGYTNARYDKLGKAPTVDPATGAIIDKGFVADNGLPVVVEGTRDPVTGALLTPCPERTSDPNHTCDLPKTPEWKVYIGPQYIASLPGGGALQFNVDWTYTSKLANDFGNSELLLRPSTNIFNASVTYRVPGDQFEFVVGGVNLSDERYIVTGLNQGGVAVVDASYNAPRQWFATLRFIPHIGGKK